MLETQTSFTFEERASDSPHVEFVWRTRSEAAGSFMSQAANRWEMVLMRHRGRSTFTVRGPETKATPADFPADAEWLGIVFRPGSFMPHLTPGAVRDRGDLTLPEATHHSFWLLGSAWQLPTYDNADTFVNRLAREDVLVCDPLVEDVLQGQPPDLSLRTVQRRFLQATGLTHNAYRQIERARQAIGLLQQGVPILDAAFEAGYFDQPHLTRSLKHYMGQTPAQIARLVSGRVITATSHGQRAMSGTSMGGDGWEGLAVAG